MHFTDPWSEVGILLHRLHNFLVLVGQFSEGCSCDVLLGLYMAVHAHGYSEREKKSLITNFPWLEKWIKVKTMYWPDREPQMGF